MYEYEEKERHTIVLQIKSRATSDAVDSNRLESIDNKEEAGRSGESGIC